MVPIDGAVAVINYGKWNSMRSHFLFYINYATIDYNINIYIYIRVYILFCIHASNDIAQLYRSYGTKSQIGIFKLH